MRHHVSEISLGDLAYALKKLQPTNDDTRLAIAKTLGMTMEISQKVRSAVKRTSKKVADEKPVPSTSTPTFEPLVWQDRPLASRVEHTRSEMPLPSIYVPPLPRSAPESETQSPPLEPLFFARWTRGILSAALATNSEIGEVDVEQVVKTLATGRSVKKFPLLSSPTLNRGVQLLIDRSQAMEPFIKDQARLHQEIMNVVGSDRVTTLRFVGCPTRAAGSGPHETWSKYEPPLTGSPVLLLTDLGIGRPRLSDERSGVSEWLNFAQLLKKFKCPLIAFVPYGESRWPPALRNHMSIIQWDRNTTAITVNNKVKSVREYLR
jgi:hypothetical protein